MINQEYIAAFNEAAQAAAQGNNETALALFEKIIAGDIEVEGTAQVTADFIGITHMRKAFCLMDLERFVEAEAAMTSDMLTACCAQFEARELFDYHFVLGNIYGYLKNRPLMHQNLAIALKINLDEIQNVETQHNVWNSVLHFGEELQAWDYLQEQAEKAVLVGGESNDPFLQIVGGKSLCKALARKGETARLNQVVDTLVERMRELGLDQELVDDIEQLRTF